MSALLEEPKSTNVGNYFISNYPPFSCWNAESIPKFLSALSHRPAEAGLSIYTHIPFCKQRCRYCYFRVYPRRSSADVDLYIQTVLKELSLYLRYPALDGRAITSLYFGGGSPSYLEARQLEQLIGGMQALKDWEAVEECTFECEPANTTPEKLDILKRLGVTRLSLGFQSLDDEVLRRSGRDVTVKNCFDTFAAARKTGFNEINVDLLAGLPGETEKSWSRTIDQVLELLPDCVTIYQLEITYNSKLYIPIKAGHKVDLPTWQERRDWTGSAFEQLEKAGYTIGSGYMALRDPAHWQFYYTVEHFWKGADLLALGESSFGHVGGVHYQNVDTFGQYVDMVSAGKMPIRRALKLTPEERLRREVILLLKTGVLDCAYFRKKYSVEILDHLEAEFELLLKEGLVEMEGDIIRLKRPALLRVDSLLPLFYLPEHRNIRYT